MITIEQATNFTYGQTLYHLTAKNADGTAVRCRVNGACKTWKRDSGRFRLPLARGLYEHFYLTPTNADEWNEVEPLTSRAKNGG